jgi:hypothetical protein
VIDTLGTIVALAAAVFVALAAHEVGHLAAGRLAGFRFGLLAVGPLWVMRSVGRRRIRWRWAPAYWAPMAFAYPPDGRRIARRVFGYIAGGPAMSLALAAGAYWLGQNLEPSLARQFTAATALASAGIFIATAQPFVGTGIGLPTDGARLWAYVADTERARDVAAAMALDGLACEGVRPRQWDEALVARVGRVTAPPPLALGAAVSLFRYDLDREDLQSARARIERLRELAPQVPAMLRGAAVSELAFWMEHYEHDPQGAKRLLAAGGVAPIDLEWAAMAPRITSRRASHPD